MALLDYPVSILWTAASAMLSVSCKNHWGGLRASKYRMSYRAVFKDREVWRAVTSSMLQEEDLPTIFSQMLFQFFILRVIERQMFRRKPVNFLTALFVGIALIVAPGYQIKELRMTVLSEVFMTMLLTWACSILSSESFYVFGIVPINPIIAPPGLLAFRYIRSGKNLLTLKRHGVGYAMGFVVFACFQAGQGTDADRRKRREAARRSLKEKKKAKQVAEAAAAAADGDSKTADPKKEQ